MRTLTLSFAPSRTPQWFTSNSTSPGEGLMYSIPQKKSRLALSSSGSYPKRTRRAEETAFISEIFDHAAQAHEHLSAVYANISTLAKITDKTTLHTVINGAVRPLVQINIPEGFLNPVEDRWPKTTEEERHEKVQKMVLPIPNAPCLAHEPKNGPTCILAAAVWLKLNRKYFNEGTAKEACDRFEVRAKQLSRVLMGRKYLGGTQARKHKATEELPV